MLTVITDYLQELSDLVDLTRERLLATSREVDELGNAVRPDQVRCQNAIAHLANAHFHLNLVQALLDQDGQAVTHK